MSGRRPLPAAIKKLKGTFQPCRANHQEPTPPPGPPHMPRHLSSSAREEWHRLQKSLGATKADFPLLAVAAQQSALHLEASEMLNREGLFLGGKPHPAIKIANDAAKVVQKIRAEFRGGT